MMGSTHILFINPSIPEGSQNAKINALVYKTFPSSLGVLAGYLRGTGIENIHLIDEQIHPIHADDVPSILSTLQKPRIIGISVLTINSGRAYQLVELIKATDPEAKVILGGIHPTVLPEESLNVQGVDVVARGEAEETLKEFVECILHERDYQHIRGISYKNLQGKIVHNPLRPLIKNLDEIPPFPYDLFAHDMHAYPNFSCILGSRGCPYNCSFCSSRSISGRNYRHHSVGRIISEIQVLIKTYRQTAVHLLDDNIAVNKSHFMKLCDAIIAEGLHREAFFHGSLRGDNATDEVLEKAYQANFKILYYGLETGTERLMNAIDKGETLADITAAIERSARKGFAVGTTVIFGLPTEQRNDRYEAMKLVQRLPLSSVRFNTLTPYPGTPVYEEEFPKGHILVKKHWENFGVQYLWESDDIPYVPEGNDRLELIFDTMWANFSYYVSFSGLKRLFTQKVAGGNVIKLQDKWYFSAREIGKMGTAFLYLFGRFAHVAIRMLWRMIRSKCQGIKR